MNSDYDSFRLSSTSFVATKMPPNDDSSASKSTSGESTRGAHVPGWVRTVTDPGIGRRSNVQEVMAGFETAFPKQGGNSNGGGQKCRSTSLFSVRLLEIFSNDV
jgi:hypothetical protein